jgi:lysophospholipase
MGYSDAAYEQNLDDIFGNSEAEISTPDYSGRTALHYAASLGDKRTLEYLLRHGASVHTRDNRGFSPLRDAIEFDRHEVIHTLRQCGAHLTQDPTALGAELCLAASKGSVLRLRSYELAGAHLEQEDPCGRTALHAAVESRSVPAVEWLLRRRVSRKLKNAFGQTPVEIAKLLKCPEIVSLLEQQ